MENATPLICPKCHSKKTETFLYIEPSAPPRLFVRCAECGEFLARVAVCRYASFETYESVLHNFSYAQRRSFASAREINNLIEHFDENVRENYERARKVLDEHPQLPEAEERFTAKE